MEKTSIHTEEMKNEALSRLKSIGLHPDVAKKWEEDGICYYSERTSMGGILYWLSNEPEWTAKVDEVQQNNNILVYHATHECTMFGELLDLFYVSGCQEEWEQERQELAEGYPVVATLNLSSEDLEFGTIGFKERGGGLIRTE